MFKKLLLSLLLFTSTVFASWVPISTDVSQYVDANGDPYSGAVLKFYSAGTSTNINLATDNTGGTTATSVALNASGYPAVSGNVIIPHLEENYKIVLYPSQAAADADSSALWTVDNIEVAGAATNEWQESGITPVFSSTTAFTISGDSTSTFHVGRRLKILDSGGTDYATVTVSSYVDPTTTITVAIDSTGTLDSGISSAELSILSANNISLPYVRKNNFVATTAPAVTDDIDGNYYVGSVWINTTDGAVYTNADNSDGAAVWTVAGSEVGDISYSMKTSKVGWFLLRGQTIGSAASGATSASAKNAALYTVLWTNCADTECAVSTGRGGSAAIDFAANKTLTIPDARGRDLRGKDNMGGSSANTNTHAQGDLLAGKEGAETHTLVTSEMPEHTHSYNNRTGGNQSIGTGPATSYDSTAQVSGATGGDGAHNNMSPYLTVNTFIKY